MLFSLPLSLPLPSPLFTLPEEEQQHVGQIRATGRLRARVFSCCQPRTVGVAVAVGVEEVQEVQIVAEIQEVQIYFLSFQERDQELPERRINVKYQSRNQSRKYDGITTNQISRIIPVICLTLPRPSAHSRIRGCAREHALPARSIGTRPAHAHAQPAQQAPAQVLTGS